MNLLSAMVYLLQMEETHIVYYCTGGFAIRQILDTKSTYQPGYMQTKAFYL